MTKHLARADYDALTTIHEQAAHILHGFVHEAARYNNVRRDAVRSNYPSGFIVGAPSLHVELEFTEWFPDGKNVVIPAWEQGDDIRLPVEVLTGELDPTSWVDSLWEEHYRRLQKAQDDAKATDIEHAIRLAEKHGLKVVDPNAEVE